MSPADDNGSNPPAADTMTDSSPAEYLTLGSSKRPKVVRWQNASDVLPGSRASDHTRTVDAFGRIVSQDDPERSQSPITVGNARASDPPDAKADTMSRANDNSADDKDTDTESNDMRSHGSTGDPSPQDRVEALQRANEMLGYKLREEERTLQVKMSEHESTHEDMQMRLEEVSNELGAAKREEKELRSNERANRGQIATLETEVAKLTRALDNARMGYANLQKQYQDQLVVSERYRIDLRERDEALRLEREAAERVQLDVHKLEAEEEQYVTRIVALEEELALAQQAQNALDEQRKENMLLKETIDRLRFDLDELRSSGASGRPETASSTISRSLGAELAENMRDWGGWKDEEDGARVIPGGDEEEDDADGDDVVQTILTRRGRKGPSVVQPELEERREYSDAATQLDAELFYASSGMQTETASSPRDPGIDHGRVQAFPDSPPAYIHEYELTPEEKADHESETLKKHHPGMDTMPSSVSSNTMDEWVAVKKNLGVSCTVIDKIFETSTVTLPNGANAQSDDSLEESGHESKQSLARSSELEFRVAALSDKARIDLFGKEPPVDAELNGQVPASAPAALVGSGVLPHTRLDGGIFKNFGNISGSHIQAPTIMPVIAPGASVRTITITQTNAALDIHIQAQQAYNDLRALCIHARYSAANTPLPCPPGTRVKIIEDIIHQLTDPAAPHQIIYLGGSTDFDKSPVAKSIAQKLAQRGTLAASFFFSARVAGRGEASVLPLALAYQLGQYSAKFRAELGLRLLEDPQLMYDDPPLQIATLVISILDSLEHSKIPWVICLDGLDICLQGDAQMVMRWLEEYPLPPFVRLLVTGGTPVLEDCLSSGPLKGITCLLELEELDAMGSMILDI
ncbi:hypothetical protein MKEN_00494400 [Mycena kentingensis (nom. inval.)]|nr:hypothetical protein MKEN_00494400 [Mycena kentingensis (nom. inval.)]